MEHRSAEMLDAVSTVWRFYHEHEDDLLAAYDAASEADMKVVAAAEPLQRIDVLKTTLHYKRRLVSSFYVILAELYTAGLYPRKRLFAAWSKGDLQIIPGVLLPIEGHLGRRYGTGRPKHLMETLYNDALSLLSGNDA